MSKNTNYQQKVMTAGIAILVDRIAELEVELKAAKREAEIECERATHYREAWLSAIVKAVLMEKDNDCTSSN